MKLAIIVGHNSEKQGAVRKDTGESEYRFNSRLAQMMLDELERNPRLKDAGLEIKIFFRRPGLGYTREIREVYDEVDYWGAWASMELHFNSAGSAAATGTETLSSGTALSLKLATAVQEEVVQILGLRDRGIKTRSSGRGSASLIAGKAPAILVEPFFGSSKHGQAATDEAHEMRALAAAYLIGAVRAMRAFPRANLDDSRTMVATRKINTATAFQLGTGGAATALATVSTEAQRIVDGLPSIGSLAQYLPYISAGLAIVALLATVYIRNQKDAVEAARVDDHERTIR